MVIHTSFRRGDSRSSGQDFMRTGRNLHCAGPNVRHNFSPILSKYFLLPTSSVFRMCVQSIFLCQSLNCQVIISLGNWGQACLHLSPDLTKKLQEIITFDVSVILFPIN